MTKKNVHVVPAQDGWGVKIEGNEKNSYGNDSHPPRR